VQFESEYQYQPVINANLASVSLDQDKISQLVLDGICEASDGQEVCEQKLLKKIWQSHIKYIVEQGHKKGFRITLEDSAPFSLTFAWQALAIKDGKVTTSEAPANLGIPFEGSHKITENFGVQADDQKINEQYHQQGLKGHDGIDFGMDIGTHILAVDDGIVEDIPSGVEAYGTTVVVKHQWGKSFYGHLSTAQVKPGDKVTKGQKIALSGNSGFSTAPHLHFGMSLTNTSSDNGYLGKVDPADYLPISSKTLNLVPVHETSASGIWANH
jgi:murein DD-endopeptidase MepM/ murein hydrolase activator NlpD